MMSKRNRMMRVLWPMASNSHYCRIEQNPLPLLSDGVSHLYKDFWGVGVCAQLPFLCSFCHIVVQVSLDDEPIKFFSICKISLCLDNSPRSQSLKTFLDYPYFLLCFHKFWCFFMKFPWNSLFCWYLYLSLHIPTNKERKFYDKSEFKTEIFGYEDWGKNCCPCQGTCIHNNQILRIWPGFRNRQNILHYQE